MKPYFETELGKLYHGDCLEIMPQLEPVDLVLTDPPYEITACGWDAIIPFEPMWEQLERVIKPNCAVVMTASQPFTTKLINSNIKMFRYEWIWEKSRSTGFLQANYMPMKSHENILIFVKEGTPTYNPQKTAGHKPTNSAKGYGHSPTFGNSKERDYKGGDTTRNPKTVQYFKSERGYHPTQKPVTLMEYLIKTYSNKFETVLDFTIGSGTTAIACERLNRRWIGIEISEEYCEIAKQRIINETRQLKLFV